MIFDLDAFEFVGMAINYIGRAEYAAKVSAGYVGFCSRGQSSFPRSLDVMGGNSCLVVKDSFGT